MTTKINFNKNLDELVLILKLKKKGNIVRFCIKNFKENIDYIILKPNFDIKKNKKQGGLNEINYFLTEALELSLYLCHFETYHMPDHF